MGLVKASGVVLKVINLGESDKIITLFTENLGKIHAVAHGARKAKSKMLATTQMFSYCEYVLYKGRNMYTVSQSQVRESFQGLLNDLYTLTYSSYLAELVDVLTQDGEENIELFVLLLKSLYLMMDKNIDKEMLIRAFEIKSMSISGFMPNFYECAICGSNKFIAKGFDVRLGGVVCKSCMDKDKSSVVIDASTANMMRYIIENDIGRLGNLKVSKENKNEMKKIMKNYIKYHLDRDFKSLELINRLEHVDNM